MFLELKKCANSIAKILLALYYYNKLCFPYIFNTPSYVSCCSFQNGTNLTSNSSDKINETTTTTTALTVLNDYFDVSAVCVVYDLVRYADIYVVFAEVDVLIYRYTVRDH